MSEGRPAVKLDFTTGLEQLPSRPKMDEAATQASVEAGRELGFSGRQSVVPTPAPVPLPVVAAPQRLDGRRLRSRGANIQMNLKVTAEEKEMILAEAMELMQDPRSPVGSIGEFVVHAVETYRSMKSGRR